jgi:hypothetical protein
VGYLAMIMPTQLYHLVVYLMTYPRIFTTKTFSKWQRKTGLSDQSLIKAIQEIQSGLVDARLAKGLVKKRVAQSGRGKQSSARTLVATYFEARWFFIFGFSKNEKFPRRRRCCNDGDGQCSGAKRGKFAPSFHECC